MFGVYIRIERPVKGSINYTKALTFYYLDLPETNLVNGNVSNLDLEGTDPDFLKAIDREIVGVYKTTNYGYYVHKKSYEMNIIHAFVPLSIL